MFIVAACKFWVFSVFIVVDGTCWPAHSFRWSTAQGDQQWCTWRENIRCHTTEDWSTLKELKAQVDKIALEQSLAAAQFNPVPEAERVAGILHQVDWESFWNEKLHGLWKHRWSQKRMALLAAIRPSATFWAQQSCFWCQICVDRLFLRRWDHVKDPKIC